jgi:hypothetical protein
MVGRTGAATDQLEARTLNPSLGKRRKLLQLHHSSWSISSEDERQGTRLRYWPYKHKHDYDDCNELLSLEAHPTYIRI